MAATRPNDRRHLGRDQLVTNLRHSRSDKRTATRFYRMKAWGVGAWDSSKSRPGCPTAGCEHVRANSALHTHWQCPVAQVAWRTLLDRWAGEEHFNDSSDGGRRKVAIPAISGWRGRRSEQASGRATLGSPTAAQTTVRQVADAALTHAETQHVWRVSDLDVARVIDSTKRDFKRVGDGVWSTSPVRAKFDAAILGSLRATHARLLSWVVGDKYEHGLRLRVVAVHDALMRARTNETFHSAGGEVHQH